MNRLCILAVLLSLIPINVFSQSDAVFVYRNDGDFNAFLLSDIEQMTQSKEDTLGILHEDYCVQEIWTTDSLYRIPISAIDSIGFHPLPIEYQSNVVFVSSIPEFEQWIIEASDSTILLSSYTPVGLIPEKGKILFEPSDTYHFPNGFCGRVINSTNDANGIMVYFETPNITDVYKTLQFVAHGITQNDNGNRAKTRSEDYIQQEVTILNLPNEITLSLGPVSLSVKPEMQVYSYVVIRDGELSIKNRLTGHFDCEASLSISSPDDSPLKYEPEPAWWPAVRVPLGPTGFFIRAALGVFLQAELTGEISTGLPFSVDGDITMSRVNNKVPQINCNLKPSSDFNYNMSINANGWVADGLAVQAGIEWVGNYAAVVFEAGPKIKASLNIHSDGAIDNNLYAAIKDTKVEGSVMADTYLSIHRAYLKEGHNFNSPRIQFEQSLASIYVLPEFDDLTWEEAEYSGSGHVNGSIYRETPLGTSIGWALYNQKDELCYSDMYSETYRFPNSWRNDGMYMDYYGLTAGAKYNAYPVVSFAGVKMRVNKSVDVITTPEVVTHGYENNGPQSTTVYGFCYYDAGSYFSQPNVGFAYSADGINWSYVPSTNFSADGSFSAVLNEIDCMTDYKYKTYVERDGIKHYGKEMSFTSDPPNVDGIWFVEQGDGDSYTVTFENGVCTWSKTMEKPGSYGFGPKGSFTFGVFESWWLGFGTNWVVYNFSGTLNDKNHPTGISGNVIRNQGNEFADHDTLNTSFTATRQ